MNIVSKVLSTLYHHTNNFAEAILLRFDVLTGLIFTCIIISLLLFGGSGLFTVFNGTIVTMTESVFEIILAVILYAGMILFSLYVLGLVTHKLWKDFFDEDDFSKE